MAPECWEDFRRQASRSEALRALDPRSDLFSVGVVLLELLSGRIPFALALDHPESLPTEQDWRDLVRRATAAAREPRLAVILDRCLAFDPERRYRDAAELSKDLSAILDSKQRIRLWTRRLAMATAASVVVGTTVTLWAWSLEDPESLPALLRRAKRHIDREEFQSAAILLDQALRSRQKDPELTAWFGYCLTRISHYDSAKANFILALSDGDRSDLRNNLGYCCAQLNQAEEAEDHFERALQLSPRLQAAFHNRANLRRDTATRGVNLPLPLECWSDYKQAAAIGPRNGKLCLDSAKAITFARLRGQEIDGNLKVQICLALASGVDPEPFRGTRFKHEHLDLDALQKAAKELPEPRLPRSTVLILPPPFPLPQQ